MSDLTRVLPVLPRQVRLVRAPARHPVEQTTLRAPRYGHVPEPTRIDDTERTQVILRSRFVA